MQIENYQRPIMNEKLLSGAKRGQMTSLRTVLAQNMKAQRQNLGISQTQLAERVKTSANYIAQIETGMKFPIKSAGGLGLQFADLVARPIGIHVLRPEQPNRAWDIIQGKIYQDGLVVLPKQ